MTVIISGCESDEPDYITENCGVKSTTLCYAHNWQEFEMLVDFPDGKGIYNHQYFHDGGISYFVYRLKVNKVCRKSLAEIELLNTVKLGSDVNYRGVLYVNGKSYPIEMQNLNGIITGKLNHEINLSTDSYIDVSNTIEVHHNINDKADDIAWYNENVSSHGMTVKFYPPK